MVTEDMFNSVSRFIDAMTRRVENGGELGQGSISTVARLCQSIVEYRPDSLSNKELEFITANAARIVKKSLDETD